MSPLLLCAVLLAGTAPSPEPPERPAPANALYAEVLGSAPVGSVNYERRLIGGWGLRGGVGFVPPATIFISNPSSALVTLLAGTYVYGEGMHRFEGGASVAFGFNLGAASELSNLMLGWIIAYRYEAPSGFLFRLALTPLLMPAAKPLALLPLIGVSAGYAF